MRAITVDNRPFSRQQLTGKNGNDPPLSSNILTGTIDIGITQNCIGQPVLLMINFQVVLNSMLAGTVGSQRLNWALFL